MSKIGFAVLGAIGLMLLGSAAQAQQKGPIPYIPNGVQVDISDPGRGFDPNTGENFAWDPEKHVWVNTKTGKAVGFYPGIDVRKEVGEGGIPTSLTGCRSTSAIRAEASIPTRERILPGTLRSTCGSTPKR